MDGSSERTRRIAALTDLTNCFVKTPPAQQILQAFDIFLERAASAREGRIFSIFGESRAGKSHLLRKLQLNHPDDTINKKPRRRLLYIEMPEGVRPATLRTLLLQALDDPRPDYGDLQTKDRRIREGLKHHEVLVVILDDVHHFTDRPTRNIAYKSADVIKYMTHQIVDGPLNPIYGAKDFRGTSFLLSGLPTAASMLGTNRQLLYRTTFSFFIGPFSLRSDDYRQFLRRLGEKLPFQRIPGIDQDFYAERIHLVTDGFVGRISHFLETASLLAIGRGDVDLNISAFKEAAHQLRSPDSPSDWMNPFEVS